MDARQRRTRARLTEAILALAAATPIDEITVADVARRAGISRDTFYRWSTSPVELLAETLGGELERVVADSGGVAETADTDAIVTLDSLTEALLGFVSSHADIYRRASTPRLNSVLRDGLIVPIENALRLRIRRWPQILPMIDGEPADDLARQIFVSFAASGVVGAYEVWLKNGDLGDIRGAEARIYAASAEWWRGRGRGRGDGHGLGHGGGAA